jgi:TRAP-type C4-dicarboxylate transport system permease small subunit
MGLLVLITLANVVARYFVSHSFAWTEELSVFLMVVMTLVGSAWAARSDAHIRVELFYSRGSPGQRRALALVSGLATAALFVLLAVLLARTGLSEYEYQETTTGLGVPRWWYTAALPLLSLAVAVAALRCLVRGAPPAPADDERAP